LGKFDDLSHTCEVIYLPRTPSISTTAIIEKVRG
jgi:choline-phosphate cytidylyltransferase